jgi:hypothetical protein
MAPETSNVVTMPGASPEAKPQRKRTRKRVDPTNAERQRRHRKKREPAPAKNNVTVTPALAPPATKPVVAPPRRTSWSLVTLAYGFFLLGVAINLWNAQAGNVTDMALPAAMGVLAEGVVFFLPARAMALPAGRRVLAFVLLIFVSAFALTSSLRMASIVAADQVAARADRQTVGVQTASRELETARANRDQACGKGQGKTVACKSRQDEVTKLEGARKDAGAKVAAQAKPEATDFAGLVTWLTAGTVQPGGRDFDMLWLLFRTFLPQVGGLVLMLARR